MARDPTQWEYYARSLMLGAGACRDAGTAALERMRVGGSSSDLGVNTVALYLLAQATEVLLKALAVQRTPEIVIDKRFYTHDMILTAREIADVALTDDEARLLRKMRKMIEWAGRYPIPRWDSKREERKFPTSEDDSASTSSTHRSSLGYSTGITRSVWRPA